MKKRYWLIGLFILIASLILVSMQKIQPVKKLSGLQKPSQTNGQEKTEVIIYKQTYVPKEQKEGYCWTSSNTAWSNSSAYRCMSANHIYDPCFETDSHKVVCDVDPEIPESGFELHLTQDLPIQERTIKDKPWLLKLQNGFRCYATTGAASMINGQYFYYICGTETQAQGVLFPNNERKSLIDIDKSTPMWKVQLSYPSQWENIEQSDIIRTETVNIITVWE